MSTFEDGAVSDEGFLPLNVDDTCLGIVTNNTVSLESNPPKIPVVSLVVFSCLSIQCIYFLKRVPAE